MNIYNKRIIEAKKSHIMDQFTDQQLVEKRQSLQLLMDHIQSGVTPTSSPTSSTSSSLPPSSPAVQCVLTRLLTEQQKLDVETMRRHILQASQIDASLSREALEALEDALRLVEDSAKGMQVSYLQTDALLERYPSVSETFSMESSTSGEEEDEEEERLEQVVHDKKYLNGSIKVEPSAHSVPSNGKKKKKKNKTSSKPSILGRLLRMLFLDLPLLSTFALVAATFSARHIYHSYYVPIMEALVWFDRPDRHNAEYTSYMRTCSADDVTTTNMDDLIIDEATQSPQEAADLVNRHGVSVFPHILKPETANAMRDYVLKRNAALTSEDAIPLISQNQRWSFPIGANDDPSIPPVLKEIATHPLLSATMEKVFGKDAAMVELTAITSAYGAGDQHWHADNDYMSSQQHYARSFVSMYSLFIPLQDTTKAMGATSACPGTHLCGEESKLDDVCGKLNFQIHDSRGRLANSTADHVWKAGDGMLMQLNTYHRGPGHTDRNGGHRVMLIMSISPRPNGPYFDKRQISLGTSYSQRWDMWGLTMEDLKDGEAAMRQPWRTLRALGIYKATGPNRSSKDRWGWDHLTVACSRIVNDQMGFRYEDLETFTKKMVQRGQLFNYLFGYLPAGEEISETGWREYFPEMFDRCVKASKILCGVLVFVYLIFSGMYRGVSSTVLQVFKLGFFIAAITGTLLHYLSQTPWGSDILSGKYSQPPFTEGTKSLRRLSGPTVEGLLTVMPTSNDILIGTRLDSPHMADHNYINDHQLGNAALKPLVHQFSGAFTLVSPWSSNKIQDMIMSNIFQKMTSRKSRFLLQNQSGDWLLMNKKNVLMYLKFLLASESHPMKKKLNQELLFLKSECRHGRKRDTAMMSHHCLARAEELEMSVLMNATKNRPSSKLAHESVAAQIKTRSLVPPVVFAQKNIIRKTIKKADEKKMNDNTFEINDKIEGDFGDDGW